MMQVLLLRFDAPLVSFGDVRVDNHGPTRRFPGRSLLAGLLANALGHEHAEHERTQDLQKRIHYAVRCDRRGRRVRDFQTVDLGQPFMLSGWTTSGELEERRGGEAAEKTHIRYRDYIADAVYTIALTLVPVDAMPTLVQLEVALRSPARPLFIGRKPCLPACPLLLSTVSAETLVGALITAPRVDPARSDYGDEMGLEAWWPEDEQVPEVLCHGSRVVAITDERDWANQIHVGRRLVREGRIVLTEAGA